MFTCQSCGKEFDLPQHVLDRYPGWTPRQCLDCRNGSGTAGSEPGFGKAARGSSVSKGRDLTLGEVLAKFSDGPQTGVFTDGASEGNPGPGGWGAVLVVDGQVVTQDHGSEAHTTNNRMELTAMIAGLKMLPPDTPTNVYTDSQLVVNILTKWAKGWEARGWTKKSPGPIANLELVQEAYELTKKKPKARIQWIPAHSGYRWNEYADALATAYRRDAW
ncbi:MAG TPA: ribonuclease H [Acidimicrobiia bacterium]|nr:ribonuclease H [Acidimicrobiia bacterium]